MTGDTYTLIGIGLGVLLVAWLVLSMFKKVIGLLFLAAVAFGGYLLWNDPELLASVLGGVQRMLPGG